VTEPLRLVIRASGHLVHTHHDELSAMTARLGAQTIRRASHIERWPDLREDAQRIFAANQNRSWPPSAEDVAEFEKSWILDLTPSGGPVLPFETRQAALKFEVEWLAKRYTESS
jgi:hypothetical protein